MEQEITQLGRLFQKFQFSFNQASPEEQKRLSAQLDSWAGQQLNSLSFLPLKKNTAEGGEVFQDASLSEADELGVQNWARVLWGLKPLTK